LLPKALFVKLSTVAELSDASAPCAVTACLQVLPHQSLDLVLIKAVQGFNLLKTGMIAERHLDDFA
jgi:hypothetical protein